MSRDISASAKTAAQASVVYPVYLCEMFFDSGTVRVSSHFKDMAWQGNTYTGLGSFAGIDQAPETRDIKAEKLSLSLSGIPSETISLALGQNCRGRKCNLWLALLDSAGALVDAVLVFGGRMDQMRITEAGATANVSVTVESRLVDLERPLQRRYTHDDQQIDFPGDLGLQFVEQSQEKEIFWGRPFPK